MQLITYNAFRSLSVISGLCLAMLTPSVASAVLIDNFLNPLVASPLTATLGGTNPNFESQAGLSGVLGGARDSTVQVLSATGAGTKRATLDIGFGALEFGSNSGVSGYFDVEYSAIGPVDVTAPGGSTFFFIPVTDNDTGGVFTLTLSDGTFTGMSTIALGAAVVGTQQIAVDVPAYASVNLNALTNVILAWSGAPANDLAIAGSGFSFQTVPEPSSLVIALGFLGCVGGRRLIRRRKQLTA